MKIALIHYRLLLKGGLETRLLSYMKYLVSTGHELSIIVSKISGEVSVPEGVKIVQLKHWRFPKVYAQEKFNRKVCAYMNANHFDYSISLGRTSCQDVVLAPGNHPGYLAALGKQVNSESDKVQTRLDRLAYENSKHIFAASSMMKKEVMKFFGIPESKISILHPPIDTNKFHLEIKKDKEKFRSKYNFSPDKKSFLFVSTGHERKGLSLLLKVFENLADCELLVAGSPPIRGKFKNVLYLGFIESTHELFSAADFTIHPAKYEPYGQIIAESIACGTPVIISDMVGAKEIVGPENGIIVENNEVAVWLEVIRGLDKNQFSFDGNWAKNSGLTISQHMEILLGQVNN